MFLTVFVISRCLCYDQMKNELNGVHANMLSQEETGNCSIGYYGSGSLPLFSSPSLLYPLVRVTHLYRATAFSPENPSSPLPLYVWVCSVWWFAQGERAPNDYVVVQEVGAQFGEIFLGNIETPRIALNNKEWVE